MSKTRQRRFPDGSTWVRTYPVTFLHDQRQVNRGHAWHVLTYAVRGRIEVITGEARRLVPADRAVWIPAGTPHTIEMHAPVSMRSLYVAPGAFAGAREVQTVEVTPLLRELILHITSIGALDRSVRAQAGLARVLFDLLADAREVKLELRTPRDVRARRFAELVTDDPAAPLAVLARKAGASLRTLERCFLAETGIAIGEWRRRVRLFAALGRLEAGASVTEVALDVGYASTSAFCQAFRRQFGRSPTGRRRDMRQA